MDENIEPSLESMHKVAAIYQGCSEAAATIDEMVDSVRNFSRNDALDLFGIEDVSGGSKNLETVLTNACVQKELNNLGR